MIKRTSTLTCVAMGCVMATTSFAVAGPYSDAINALNPDAYWRGEEGAGGPVDTTSNGNDLTDFATNTFGAGPTSGDGFLGMDAVSGAYQFDHTNGAQVARSDTYAPALGQDPRTIITWVNTDQEDVNGFRGWVWQYGVDMDGNNTGTGWALRITEGFNPNTGAGTGQQNVHLNIQGRQIVALDTAITPGEWNMIAVAFEGDGSTPLGEAEIYVNGVLQTQIVEDTGEIPNTGGAGNNPLGFRMSHALGNEGLDGRIDETSVHLSKLSEFDVQNLFHIATTGVPIPEPASLALLGLGGLMMLRRSRS